MATIERIDLYNINQNSRYNHTVSTVVKNFDSKKHRILLRVDNIIYDVLDRFTSKNIYIPIDKKKGLQPPLGFGQPKLKTVTIYAQLYDYQNDIILETKKQDFTESFFFGMYTRTGALTTTLANTFTTYWNKTRRVEKVEGPFTTAECTTLATEIKTGTKYYFAATPKQVLNQTELLLMKWQYRYDDGEFTYFNYAVETQNVLKNVISCSFHKNPSKIQVYAFFKEPNDEVSVKFTPIRTEIDNTQNNENVQTPPESVPGTENNQKVTIEQIEELFGKSRIYRDFRQKIIDNINKYSTGNFSTVIHLDTPLRKAHFFAQVGAETLGINPDWMVETDKKRYSRKNCFAKFGDRAKKLEEMGKLTEYCNEIPQKKLLNFLYADENGFGNGNGNEASGDGYKYRGRGLKQLTGAGNYKEATEFIKEIFPEDSVDLVANPEKVKEPKYAVLTAIAYWEKKEIWKLADTITQADDDKIKKIRRKVNPGLAGWKETKTHFIKGLEVFKEKPATDQSQPIIRLIRKWQNTKTTIGTFTIDGSDISGYILEEKGPSSTQANKELRVPVGEYELRYHAGTHIKKGIHIWNNEVPWNRYILMHTGNTASDTEGCLILGSTKVNANFVGDSVLKFNEVYNYLKTKNIEDCRLIITENFE